MVFSVGQQFLDSFSVIKASISLAMVDSVPLTHNHNMIRINSDQFLNPYFLK